MIKSGMNKNKVSRRIREHHEDGERRVAVGPCEPFQIPKPLLSVIEKSLDLYGKDTWYNYIYHFG